MPSWEGWCLDALSFYFLGALARDDLGQPGENVMVFAETHQVLSVCPTLSVFPDTTSRQTDLVASAHA